MSWIRDVFRGSHVADWMQTHVARWLSAPNSLFRASVLQRWKWIRLFFKEKNWKKTQSSPFQTCVEDDEQVVPVSAGPVCASWMPDCVRESLEDHHCNKENKARISKSLLRLHHPNHQIRGGGEISFFSLFSFETIGWFFISFSCSLLFRWCLWPPKCSGRRFSSSTRTTSAESRPTPSSTCPTRTRMMTRKTKTATPARKTERTCKLVRMEKGGENWKISFFFLFF